MEICALFVSRAQSLIRGHRSQRGVRCGVGNRELLAERQTDHPSQSQLVFGDLIFLCDQLLLLLLQLDACAEHINCRRRPGTFLIAGAVVDGLVCCDLRPLALGTGRACNHEQVGVSDGLHH